jgi:HPt (histidine-containing phosphotransfer) domain-containing protein
VRIIQRWLEDLIPNYLANRRQDIRQLALAVETGELEPARLIGHGIKGSGSVYGFPEISEIGRSIDQSVVEGGAAGISRQISNLADYLERVEVVYP